MKHPIKQFFLPLIFIATAVLSTAAQSTSLDFDLVSATPIGSWQEREETTTNHKGKTTVTVMKSSLLAKEERNGKAYYWIEMAVDSFKVSKKGKRKKNGKRMIIKTLVPESALQGDPGNVLTNLRGFGEEIIMQSGNDQPMRISGSGGMFAGLMQAMGTEVNFDFSVQGNESVEVPAGSFTAKKVTGSGTTETKVVFKKIKVQSDSTVWLSDTVPFGVVKAEGTSTMNGKPSTHTTQLLSFGATGAESQITGEPQEMPTMGNIFGQ